MRLKRSNTNNNPKRDSSSSNIRRQSSQQRVSENASQPQTSQLPESQLNSEMQDNAAQSYPDQRNSEQIHSPQVLEQSYSLESNVAPSKSAARVVHSAPVSEQSNPVQSNPGQQQSTARDHQSQQFSEHSSNQGQSFRRDFRDPFPPPYYQTVQPPFYYQVPPQYAFRVVYPTAPPTQSSRQDARAEERPGGPRADWIGFTDKKIRAQFVRKVYLTLMVQLLFTMGVISLFVFEPHVKEFVRSNIVIYYVSFATFLGVYIGLVCCGDIRRKYPTNIILLAILTAAMSYMLGTISSFHKTEIVFMAVGICAAVCLLVSIFSYSTKTMVMVYAGLGATVFTLYLAYDTQLILGGRKYELSPEEYIMAVIQLYIDIVYIFLNILILIGLGDQ
ncbi:protein lifeguard 3-like isoform X2 [Stegodyphus dumicola]|uniref:protein lifeguard 3-like isoform X2 n=1 Tax=Stegodyphus dumicola TaxID=202533 RepID=UPI0015A9FDD2|nr:protein lifeguard 3-like isoform X2 [Stegodyphus dumicola]